MQTFPISFIRWLMWKHTRPMLELKGGVRSHNAQFEIVNSIGKLQYNMTFWVDWANHCGVVKGLTEWDGNKGEPVLSLWTGNPISMANLWLTWFTETWDNANETKFPTGETVLPQLTLIFSLLLLKSYPKQGVSLFSRRRNKLSVEMK